MHGPLMFRRLKLCVLSFLLLVIAVSCATTRSSDASAPATDSPPNVVFFLIDDMGWTDLTCYGSQYYETPNIDRLAAGGIRFTDAYAACAVCSPTRAAVMTGRYPARLGVTDWIRARFQGGKIPADQKPVAGYTKGGKDRLSCPRNPLWLEHAEITIAEALQLAGYVSCHIGKWHLGPDAWYPDRQGFDFNVGGCDFGQPPSYFDPYEKKKQGGIPTLASRQPGEYLTDREADEAVSFIRDHRDKPFFLYLAHYAVHTPIQAKKDVTARYAAKPKTKQKNARYAAMIESVDDAVGTVMQALEKLQLASNTIVVFTSDNGGLLGPTHNAPLRSGKGFPYEGGVRVPLIVRWPGAVEAGRISTVPVTSVDYLPTLLEAAGADLPSDREIDGVSLLAHLRDGSARSSATLRSRSLYWHFPHYRGKLGPYSIVRDGDWKLIRRWDGPRFELFHLADDIGEADDLAQQMPSKVEELDQQLLRHLQAVGAKLPRS